MLGGNRFCWGEIGFVAVLALAGLLYKYIRHAWGSATFLLAQPATTVCILNSFQVSCFQIRIALLWLGVSVKFRLI